MIMSLMVNVELCTKPWVHWKSVGALKYYAITRIYVCKELMEKVYSHFSFFLQKEQRTQSTEHKLDREGRLQKDKHCCYLRRVASASSDLCTARLQIRVSVFL